MVVFLWTFGLIFISVMPQQGKCLTVQAFFRKQDGKYLANHPIETKYAETELVCSRRCVGHESCVSVNYKTSGIGKGRCELNSKTLQDTSYDQESSSNPEFKHIFIIKKVRKEIEKSSCFGIQDFSLSKQTFSPSRCGAPCEDINSPRRFFTPGYFDKT